MSNSSTLPVRVTNLVNDFLVIQISDENLKDVQIQYQIVNELNKTVRKGCFVGTTVQLRVSHLQEGEYLIHLCVDEKDEYDYVFTKRSSGNTSSLPYYYQPQSA